MEIQVKTWISYQQTEESEKKVEFREAELGTEAYSLEFQGTSCVERRRCRIK